MRDKKRQRYKALSLSPTQSKTGHKHCKCNGLWNHTKHLSSLALEFRFPEALVSERHANTDIVRNRFVDNRS